ncbi:MAG TPA: TIGR04255 family protein [Bacteroidia bacterium]|nr:TIGR04255 family protein [Bacteroidia bacterium]
MAIPKEINPNPLLSSTVEVRFNSKILSEDILTTVFPLISKNFPKVKDLAKIPGILGKTTTTATLNFSSGFVFANDKYSMTVSPTSIAFENIAGYQYWDNYFPVIKENLEILSHAIQWDELTRIGLRYASLFENQESTLEALNLNTTGDFKGLTQELQAFRTIYSKGDINLLLQVAKNATVRKENKNVSGLYLDIDASVDKNLSKKTNEELFSLINTLHTELKELLFNNVVKAEFLKKLNVKY